MASNPNQAKIDQLNARLDSMNARLERITNQEARAAWVNGYGANGELDPQRTALLDAMDAILSALEAAGGGPAFHPS